MDKESEEYCAEADCDDKKMAKKCMMTCEMCKGAESGEGGDTGGKGLSIQYFHQTKNELSYVVSHFLSIMKQKQVENQKL